MVNKWFRLFFHIGGYACDGFDGVESIDRRVVPKNKGLRLLASSGRNYKYPWEKRREEKTGPDFSQRQENWRFSVTKVWDRLYVVVVGLILLLLVLLLPVEGKVPANGASFPSGVLLRRRRVYPGHRFAPTYPRLSISLRLYEKRRGNSWRTRRGHFPRSFRIGRSTSSLCTQWRVGWSINEALAVRAKSN